MPDSTAQKLRALLQDCNGGVFDNVMEALSELPLPPLTMLVEGEQPPVSLWGRGSNQFMCINLHNGLVFKEGDCE